MHRPANRQGSLCPPAQKAIEAAVWQIPRSPSASHGRGRTLGSGPPLSSKPPSSANRWGRRFCGSDTPDAEREQETGGCETGKRRGVAAPAPGLVRPARRGRTADRLDEGVPGLSGCAGEKGANKSARTRRIAANRVRSTTLFRTEGAYRSRWCSPRPTSTTPRPSRRWWAPSSRSSARRAGPVAHARGRRSFTPTRATTSPTAAQLCASAA
jgi:hypothetical protein